MIRMTGTIHWRAVARYRERYGCNPERILADKIYRSRRTLAFCKEHGIRLSGPAPGKPPKNPVLSRQAKKQEYQDSCGRNAVEGIFGTAKTAYGLGRITARLQETTFCVIGVVSLTYRLVDNRFKKMLNQAVFSKLFVSEDGNITAEFRDSFHCDSSIILNSVSFNLLLNGEAGSKHISINFCGYPVKSAKEKAGIKER